MDRPQTRYVSVGDADVAYQVVGDGPTDLVYFYGIGANVELFWDAPLAPRFLRQLASFSRLILFNRRGTGASDGTPQAATPTWEDWTDDLLAVLDAAGSREAALLAAADAGPIAMLFSAMHPERVKALVLLTTAARYLRAEDYPIGAEDGAVELLIDTVRRLWGTPELHRLANPSMATNDEFLEFGAKWFRLSATPRTAAAQLDYSLRSLDVREILPLIHAPTLVIHAQRNALFPVEHGRCVATHIKGSKLVELATGDNAITPETYVVADEVAEFLTGERRASEVERVLTTILFTDICDSTNRAAELGDAEWRGLLDAHDRAVRDQLRRFRGREVKSIGDGFLAAFDGPARAITCATAIVDAVRRLDIEVRAGLHTGECEVRGDDLGGLSVHIAARVGAVAGRSEVIVSSTVKDLVIGSGIRFEDRGERELKGVPGTWQLFAVVG